MKPIFNLSLLSLTLLFAACTSGPVDHSTTTPAQQTDDYSAKIDSLIKTTQPRSFNGVVLVQQNELLNMQKHMDLLISIKNATQYCR